MSLITEAQYFGPYEDHPEATDEMRRNAFGLLTKVNEVLAAAIADGVELQINPHTGCKVAGEGNGGFRPSTVTVGAPHSKHRLAHAVDVYDPDRSLAHWTMANEGLVQAAGLCIENPKWTGSPGGHGWVHYQDVPVASGVFAFIPSAAPATDPTFA